MNAAGLAIAFALSVTLTACAVNPQPQQPQSFQEGMQLMAQGRLEEGLERLEQASREAPQNVEYRSALFKQRELAVNQLLAQGEIARIHNDFARAEAVYLRALRIDPGSVRAKQELDYLMVEQRHRAAVAEAEALFQKKDLAGAEQKVRTVLTENPTHREAAAIQHRIDEERVREARAATTLKRDMRKPITLDFRDATVRSVFEAIARSSGVNYVFDRDVRADLRVSIQLRNKSIEDAVRVILATNQLAQKIVDEDTVIIYPNVPAKQREYQELVIRVFYLANADVKQVLNAIRSVIRTRDIIFDERLNALVMRDTPEAVRAAEKLVALKDQPEPEVMLQLEVMEVSLARLQELGVRLPEQIRAGVVGAENIPGRLTLPEWRQFSSSLVRLTVTDPAVIVNLRRLDSEANLLANPHVRVRNRERARIHIGERVPVITSVVTPTVGVSETVTYLDVGLRLELEPNIHLDDEVAMRVGLEVSNILETIARATGTQVYRLGTRNTSTTLRLRDGETQILAGLIQNDERQALNKVPGLSDLPVIGRLFTNRTDNVMKTEIVLLITPRIVRNIVRPRAETAEFPVGTEATLGAGAAPGVPAPPVMVPPRVPAPPPPKAPAPKAPTPPAPGLPGLPGGPPLIFGPPVATPPAAP
jgi:general secretion pathway protein D